MNAAPLPPFAAQLRRYRIDAGLSQEELAERAGLSAHAIGALERGVRRAPYRATVELLAEALNLGPRQRDQFLAAVSRRRGPVTTPALPGPVRTNIPAPATSFVGREQEQATVLRLLETARLLTITGIGGVGKTRLATHVAAALADEYPDGVWLVELAALVDPALVPQAVARAAGVREEPDRSIVESLAAALREKKLLLLLDNCEHLRAAAAGLAETLLRACPGLGILATSREALGVIGETVWWLPPMAVPGAGFQVAGSAFHGAAHATAANEMHRGTWNLEPGANTDAVRLFVERATAAHPAFALTQDNAGAVAAICRRLDGIPLAIELAAARARVLTAAQIAARLDERFRLLTRGSSRAGQDGGSPALLRQQTLRAALDWSYDLLSLPERRLLERLSVFAGGCEIEAVEAVCQGGEVEAAAAFDQMTALVEKSLLTVEHRGDAARYILLETVRAYGQERLAGAGSLEEVQGRHFAWCLAIAGRESHRVVGPEQLAAIAHLTREVDNLRAALAFAERSGRGAQMGELAALLWRFWLLGSAVSEGREWIARALRLLPDPTQTRGQLLDALGALSHVQGAYDAALRAHEESLAIWRALGDEAGAAGALNSLGVTHKSRGDLDAAVACLAAALAIWRATGRDAYAAMVLNNLAAVALDRGDFDAADRYQEESLAFKRRGGDQPGIAVALHNLAESARQRGDYERAAALIEESLAVSRGLGLKPYVAGSLHTAGLIAARQGDLARATAILHESLALYRDLGIGIGVPLCLEALAAVAAGRGDHRTAARLLGAASSQRDILGAPLPPAERRDHERDLAACRTALGDEALAAALTVGGAMTVEEAVALALQIPAAVRP
jgi:predicted ATPase/DNA-binding XRE family transcriptional regulator